MSTTIRDKETVSHLQADGKLVNVGGNTYRYYEGYYRFGNRPPRSRIFACEGNLQEAIERFKLHCTRMDYKWCGTYVFIFDLDAVEKLRLEDKFMEPGV